MGRALSNSSPGAAFILQQDVLTNVLVLFCFALLCPWFSFCFRLYAVFAFVWFCPFSMT